MGKQMIIQESAGVIVYYEINGGNREYLILQYESGHWDFAKGKIEAGESHEEAALRELLEETSLITQIIPGFKEFFEYFFHYKGALAKKTVYFFVGRVDTKKVTLSHEHQGYMWAPYEDALKQVTFENARELLTKVEAFLNRK